MENFSNNQLLISELPDWQEVQFEKISPKYKYVLFIHYLLFLLVSTLILFGVIWINNDSWNKTYKLILFGGLAFILLLATLNIWSMRYWGYAIRENDILYRAGIFTKTVKIVPFKQVQHVDIKEGVLPRLFNLSSIELHTAGVGEGIKIPGIEATQVSQLQEFISQKIALKPND